jgi:alpha-tubulin suppressor-like RCC1 family protein
MSTYEPTTNFIGKDGEDLGKVLVPKDYLLSVYPQLSQELLGTTPELWVWGRGNGYLGTNDIINRSTPVTTFAGGTNWKQVSSGRDHTAAIKTDGTLWTWGSGTFGRLGTNDLTNRSTPVTTFAGGTNWKQVSSGNNHTAAIKTDGTLWTWGYGGFGRLGTNDTTNRFTPVTTFAGGTNWKQVSSGDRHTAAIKTDGTLWTWGRGNYGLLGTNDTINRFTPVTTFAGGTNWKQVSSGDFHTAAIKTDGTLWTWGYNSSFSPGALGTNDTISRSTPVTTFAGGTNWKQVSSGGRHTAAIKTDGTLWTWGRGNTGELGRIVDALTPVTTFAGGTNWADTPTTEPEDLYTLSAGGNHTAAIKTDGTLWTWGRGNYGELGTNNTISRSTPVTTFAGGTNWKQVSSGRDHTAAIKTDGTLWSWGYGGSGQLGTNDIINRSTPVTTFAGGTDWKQVSTGYLHTAAIKTDGTLWSWGYGGFGQLGTNDTTTRSIPVTTFAGGTNWKQISAGGFHTAAIKTDGTLWTWGNGNAGGLGTNDTTDRSTPVTTFTGGTNWKQVSAEGYAHISAIKTDGTLWTWGYGSFGILGNNNTTDRSTPVTTFAGGSSWKQVSSGFYNTTAVKTDGTLWVWGYNYGNLGTNDITQRNTPVTTFAGGTNWKQVSSGRDHTIALQDDGVNKELYVFGLNDNGQLGTNIILNQIPGEVFGNATNWKQVSSGSASNSHTAAIKTDGTLWTWGYGSFGRLGSNDTNPRNTPVTTFAGGTNWKQVSAGDAHTTAIQSQDII